jgi:hypothetical protein
MAAAIAAVMGTVKPGILQKKKTFCFSKAYLDTK